MGGEIRVTSWGGWFTQSAQISSPLLDPSARHADIQGFLGPTHCIQALTPFPNAPKSPIINCWNRGVVGGKTLHDEVLEVVRTYDGWRSLTACRVVEVPLGNEPEKLGDVVVLVGLRFETSLDREYFSVVREVLGILARICVALCIEGCNVRPGAELDGGDPVKKAKLLLRARLAGVVPGRGVDEVTDLLRNFHF
ncbi:hypothetical protein CkaCkLH20_02924 [Colletotrichum karsti]|uniref:Uncharacterized protein n=1 Tax=Colletotrichum karsti TaxID=1095194 RepID=A0A9P6IF41_9PEZI|nr:uncharacterized protein CkaCkLH20_02924 [Colletotrichum karsti]KAF9879381.1 hypothetical protein CkaCkLH20_02924 [Colletotrichum karsti]